jgi:hypothetical protein
MYVYVYIIHIYIYMCVCVCVTILLTPDLDDIQHSVLYSFQEYVVYDQQGDICSC